MSTDNRDVIDGFSPGLITRGAPQDDAFAPQPRAGLFNSVMKFNDWSSQLLRLVLPESQKVSEAERDPKITNILASWCTESPDSAAHLDSRRSPSRQHHDCPCWPTSCPSGYGLGLWRLVSRMVGILQGVLYLGLRGDWRNQRVPIVMNHYLEEHLAIAFYIEASHRSLGCESWYEPAV